MSPQNLPPVAPGCLGATVDAKERKKPPESEACGWYWIPMDFNLVEAGGIEPPSANSPPSALHAYPRLLI